MNQSAAYDALRSALVAVRDVVIAIIPDSPDRDQILKDWYAANEPFQARVRDALWGK